jgi:hypothetical protein
MELGSTSKNKFMSETKNTRMGEHTPPDLVAVAAVHGNIRKHRDSQGIGGWQGHSFRSYEHMITQLFSGIKSQAYLTTRYQGSTSYQLKAPRFLGLSFSRAKVKVVV